MIGEKIKFIRTEKGITGKELAEKAEVTPGYISQIERNLISPSLSVLMRIAEVLEIPLVSLFTEEEEEQVTVIRKDKRTKIQYHEEAGECTLVLKGTLEYHIGDTVYTLNEGDSIYVPPKTYHQLYNPTDEDVEAVATISPAYY